MCIYIYIVSCEKNLWWDDVTQHEVSDGIYHPNISLFLVSTNPIACFNTPQKTMERYRDRNTVVWDLQNHVGEIETKNRGMGFSIGNCLKTTLMLHV